MSKQINTEDFEKQSTVLETQDALSTSKNQPDHDFVLEAKVVKKKPFDERWRTNRFFLVRGSYFVLKSVWMVVMAIGAFIAFVISMLFI